MSRPGMTNSPSGSGDETKWLAALIVTAMAAVGLWFVAREPIVYALLALDWLQVKMIRLAQGGLGTTGSQIESFIEAVFAGDLPASNVSWQDLTMTSSLVGQHTRLFISVCILAMAGLVWMKTNRRRLNREFSLTGKRGPSLLHYQARQWKVTAPILDDSFTRDPAMEQSMTPMEWMRAHGISWDGRELDEELAEKKFALQVGEAWNGVMQAPLHAQSVAVVCGLSAARHPSVRTTKENLAIAWSIPDPAKREARVRALLQPLLEDRNLVQKIDRIASRHAYTNTVLFRLLEWARARGGVLASAELLWLKRIDRTAWYVVNNCGRKAFHIEGAGAVSHYFAERKVGNKVADPWTRGAVRGLENYLFIQGVPSLDDFFASEEDDDEDEITTTGSHHVRSGHEETGHGGGDDLDEPVFAEPGRDAEAVDRRKPARGEGRKRKQGKRKAHGVG